MLSINVSPAQGYCNSANELAAAIAFAVTGTFYTSAPDVAITGGGGTGATAHAVVENGVVTGIVIDNAGSGYTTNPTITIGGVTSGGGSGATATAVSDGDVITSITVTNGGGKVVTYTDNTAYASGEARKAVNITTFDRHGNKVESQITAADGDDAITVPLYTLNTNDGVDALVTVVSDANNVKDGSAYDIVLKGTGSFNMEQ